MWKDGGPSALTFAQIALGVVLVAVSVWRLYRQRADFESGTLYHLRNAGLLLIFVAALLALTYSQFEYSGRFLIAGGVICWIGIALFFYGQRGFRAVNTSEGRPSRDGS